MNQLVAKDDTIHYEIIGKGKAIVFVGGLGSFSESWEAQTSFFANKNKVLLFDPPGLGRSKKINGQLSIDDYAQSLSFLLKELAIGKVNYVGVSFGGAIGFTFALNYPKQIESLTIINMDTSFNKKIYQKYKLGLILGVNILSEIIGRKLFSGQNKEAQRKWIKLYKRNDKKDLLHGLEALKNWDVTNKVSRIQCPALVIASDKDMPSPEIKQCHLNGISNLKFNVLKHAPHFVHSEKSKEVNQIIDNFINSNSY